eukprot:8338248-Lingulodinium_polyedra.AAC.1
MERPAMRRGVMLVRTNAPTDKHGGRRLDFVATPATRPDDWRIVAGWHERLSDHAILTARPGQ